MSCYVRSKEGGSPTIQPQHSSEGLIRLGILAVPLAGLLALVGLYSTFKLGPGGILSTGDLQAMISAGYFVSQLLGNGLALTLLIFGVMALFCSPICQTLASGLWPWGR
jgi:hypothetical protein